MKRLAVIVPITFIVQMLPLSMNGFGVREATFGFYFGRLGLPLRAPNPAVVSGIWVGLPENEIMSAFNLTNHSSGLPQYR